jgi:hypothetical protein
MNFWKRFQKNASFEKRIKSLMKTYTAGCAYNNGVGTPLRRVQSLPDRSPAQQALCGTPVPHLAQNWGVTAHAVTQTEGSVRVVEWSTTPQRGRLSFSSTHTRLQQWCRDTAPPCPITAGQESGETGVVRDSRPAHQPNTGASRPTS